jgi:tRNA threonylcarbamoyladenosine biosynthesis protein TsaE
MKSVIKIQDLNHMEELGTYMGSLVFPGFLLCLEGDLGAGKTTFTKFFGKSMGVHDLINSPTFTIMKSYDGIYDLHHMDVYRLEGIGADYDLEEYIYGDGVCVIEWYKNIIDSLPSDKLVMEISIVDDKQRIIHLEGVGPYEDIVAKISHRFSD